MEIILPLKFLQLSYAFNLAVFIIIVFAYTGHTLTMRSLRENNARKCGGYGGLIKTEWTVDMAMIIGMILVTIVMRGDTI